MARPSFWGDCDEIDARSAEVSAEACAALRRPLPPASPLPAFAAALDACLDALCVRADLRAAPYASTCHEVHGAPTRPSPPYCRAAACADVEGVRDAMRDLIAPAHSAHTVVDSAAWEPLVIDARGVARGAPLRLPPSWSGAHRPLATWALLSLGRSGLILTRRWRSP